MKHKKFTKHSPEVIEKILSLHDSGDRSKDIYLNSKQLFGYIIKQSTISEILKRNNRNAKNNTYISEKYRIKSYEKYIKRKENKENKEI